MDKDSSQFRHITLHTPKIIVKGVFGNPKNIKYLPEEFHNKELCKFVAWKNPYYIKYVKNMTQNVIMTAVKSYIRYKNTHSEKKIQNKEKLYGFWNHIGNISVELMDHMTNMRDLSITI